MPRLSKTVEAVEPVGSREEVQLAIIVHPRFRHTLPTRALSPSPLKLQDLPFDVLFGIARGVSNGKDLCRFELVCREFRSVAAIDELWKHMCFKAFPVIDDVQICKPLTWRQVYRFHHKLFYDVLVYRRPDKLLNLGNGVLFLNIPVLH